MGNEVSGNLIDQLFFVVTLGGSFVLASVRKTKWNKIFTSNKALMLFYLYFALSIVWSGDPSGSLKRLVKDFGLFFAIAVMYSERDPLQAIRSVFVRCASLLFPLSVVLIKYYPRYSRVFSRNGEITVTGVATQKNSLGEIVMVFTLFLIWDYLETHPAGRRLHWRDLPWDTLILLVMGAWLLHISQSKTATLCTALGVLVIVRGNYFASRAATRAIFAAALSMPFLLFFSQQFHSLIAPIIEALGRDMTFTGRANIWAQIGLKTVNPILGAGYWNFWGGPGGEAIMNAMTTVIPNAHNGYLDIYLDGGFVGLAILFVLLVAAGLSITRKLKMNREIDLYMKVRFAVLVVAIIYNLSESAFARLGPLWFTTLLVISEFPTKKGMKMARGAQVVAKSTLLNQRVPALTRR